MSNLIPGNQKHMTLDDRQYIQDSLEQGQSLKDTARLLCKDPTTISKEIRLAALDWCKTAIPIGCLSGTVSCWIMCVILRCFVKGEFVTMPLFSVSIFDRNLVAEIAEISGVENVIGTMYEMKKPVQINGIPKIRCKR
jgi:hypothetical protein